MERFDPANNHEITPVVEVDCSEGRLLLDYFNTRLRIYPDEQFNHTEFVLPDGKLRAAKSDVLMDKLYELDFPMMSLPYVDKPAFKWYYRLQVQDLESELKQFE